jgi:hypothetical protein
MTSPNWTRDLPALRTHVLALLARGVADRRSVWRTPTLATAGAAGPQVRTVVLRGFDAASRVLTVHTDRRSPKLADLAADPRAALHVWDAASRLQARLSAIAAIHLDDDVAAAAWHATPHAARRDYASALPPGTPMAGGAEAQAPGSRNLAVIHLQLRHMDVLWLNGDGHRRARFDWTGGQPDMTWLVP